VLGGFIGLQQGEVVDRISVECANLVGIKDSSGNPEAMAENIRLFGDRISVLSGAADMTLPTLALGGRGAILAVVNFIPEICVGLYRAAKRGDLEEAGRSQQLVSYVNKVLVREHPQVAAIKTALSLKGHAAGIPRRPLKPMPEDETKTVYEDLQAMDLLQEIYSPFIQLFKFG
jgi:dihydrodipicolinate synthase/N-acetylneuraminate lyase